VGPEGAERLDLALERLTDVSSCWPPS